MNRYIYDCEVYSNIFTVTFKNTETKEVFVFVLHESQNDIDSLVKFVNDPTKCFIGYNSFSFDNQLLNYIVRKHPALTFCDITEVTQTLHALAQTIISTEYKEYIYNLPFGWLDLMKILGIKKSLKLVGVNLKWHKLQDLPFTPDSIIATEEIGPLLSYNLNDVLITEVLYNAILPDIVFREEISTLYNINAHSESRSGIANRILEKVYSEATNLPRRQFRDLRTPRKMVNFNTVVLPEINFKTTQMDKFLEEVKNHVYYGDTPFFKKNVMFDNKVYHMGLGGIHTDDDAHYFESTEELLIIDADVTSEYPSFLIAKQLYPAHLGPKFLKEFTRLKEKRVAAKHEGRNTENECLKIVLNATVGKTLSKNSWLYDPIVNLKVVINCQLLMLMLIERLSLIGIHTISANTDGITCLVPKSKLDEYYQICQKWEKLSELELEFVQYTKYIRKDVNNYIAVNADSKKKPKCKGAFSFKLDFAKGVDKDIISMALYEYFINAIPISKTILEHKDINDFCVAKKIDEKFANEFHYIKDGVYVIEPVQHVVRYYVSTTGGALVKRDTTTQEIERYEVSNYATIFNDFIEKPMNDYNIDYNHYINETQKIINNIVKPQLTLF